MWEKKIKGNTKCDKSTVTFDIGTAECENVTIECEKKKKGITECDKSTVICDVGTAQYENGIIKCEEKKENYRIWQNYSQM